MVFAGFGLHVARGGAFEMRTAFAMALRNAVWGTIGLVARQALCGQWTQSASRVFNRQCGTFRQDR
ncbi:hypothetical protein M8756_00565 [Lutimaribacter sp. EGI FJ00015]|nr:hypothetical protein [Lutimaribacter sp. EGI FJ00015]